MMGVESLIIVKHVVGNVLYALHIFDMYYAIKLIYTQANLVK